MRGLFAASVSAKFADSESKLRRICIVTGKANKLEAILKKRNSLDSVKFVREKTIAFSSLILFEGWMVTTSNSDLLLAS